MRPTPTCTYDPPPPDLITSAWAINHWLIDATTHVVSPLINTSVSILKLNIVTT